MSEVSPTTSSRSDNFTSTETTSNSVMEVNMSPSWLGIRINSERLAIGFLIGIIFVLSKFILTIYSMLKFYLSFISPKKPKDQSADGLKEIDYGLRENQVTQFNRL